jgi:hypothetical protein
MTNPLRDIFDELAVQARCLQTQLADSDPADQLLALAARGRDAASAGDRDEMLAAARVSRLLLDQMSEDARAGLAGDTLRACDACLDRLDLPLTPPPDNLPG